MYCRRLAFCIALAVVHGTAVPAAASCPVVVDGDAAVTDAVWAELDAFTSEGTPCIAVRVMCRRNGGRVEVDLRDALGGSVQREFATVGGAAAFIVSWSLRPPASATAAASSPEAAPAPAQVAATVPEPRDPSWHVEVDFAYVAASAGEMHWGRLTPSIIKRWSALRFGGGLRALTGDYPSYTTVDVEAVGGVMGALTPRTTLRGELIATRTLITFASRRLDDGTYGSVGTRAGVRAVFGVRVHRQIDVEIGAGYEYLWDYPRFDPEASNELSLGFRYLTAGLRWMP